ncbi:hypothetical protein RvY_06706 [Ramazzottius varieornatus]|uniref:Uncharacterized protein n=1 Tax=Ramazzottius varieornatus TaxID=947166 RepID=A0A1D1V5R4_RAMVA|nr:hypothetical protein RvY_06706 [Ramazzottius varieornatus]
MAVDQTLKCQKIPPTALINVSPKLRTQPTYHNVTEFHSPRAMVTLVRTYSVQWVLGLQNLAGNTLATAKGVPCH